MAQPKFFLAILLFSIAWHSRALDETSNERPQATSVRADAANESARVVAIPDSNPLKEMLELARSTPKDDVRANVVDLDFVRPGPWALPDEEPVAARTPGVKHDPQDRATARLDDPEAVRRVPDGDADEGGNSAHDAPGKSNVRAGDPEAGRPRLADEPQQGSEGSEKRYAVGASVRFGDPETLRRVASDSEMALRGAGNDGTDKISALSSRYPDPPRFAAGEGLDSQAAEVVAQMALQEQKKAAEKAATPVVPSAPAKTAAVEPKMAPASTSKPGTPAPAANLPKNTAAKKPEQDDPETRFNKLILQIAAQRKQWDDERKKAEAASKTIPGPDGPGQIRVRDPNAARVIDILNSKTPPGTVYGHVIDQATKLPVYACVRVIDQTGIAQQAPLPEGFFTSGEFRVAVASGTVKVEVARGRFFTPYIDSLDVKPGLAATAQIAVAHPATRKFAAIGWHLADLDIGVRTRNAERPLWLGPKPGLKDLLRAARAADVRILGVAVPDESSEELSQLQAANPDILLLSAFSGPRNGFHGSALGLGVKNWQGLPREIDNPDIPLREIFEEIRSREGLVVFKDLWGGKSIDIRRDVLPVFPNLKNDNIYGNAASARLHAATELPFDTLTGPAYDSFAFDGSDAAEALWFNLLNDGFRISAVGAAGGSLEGGRVPLGQTFIHVEQKPTRDNVLAAIKNGQTSISFGPAVFCKIVERDMGPGSVLPADGRALNLQVQAYASMEPGTRLDKIEIIRNGEVIQTAALNEGESQINDMRWPVSEQRTAWYMVRVTQRREVGTNSYASGKAWTSPIFFTDKTFAPPRPAFSIVSGTLRNAGKPVAGSVTALIPGEEKRVLSTDDSGHFKIKVPSSATLIFEAPNCEPVARRVFEHRLVQRALAALQSDAGSPLTHQFSSPTLLASWRLLLSDLEWNIDLDGDAQKRK